MAKPSKTWDELSKSSQSRSKTAYKYIIKKQLENPEFYQQLKDTIQDQTQENIETLLGATYKDLSSAKAQLRPLRSALKHQDTIAQELGITINIPYEPIKLYKEKPQPKLYQPSKDLITKPIAEIRQDLRQRRYKDKYVLQPKTRKNYSINVYKSEITDRAIGIRQFYIQLDAQKKPFTYRQMKAYINGLLKDIMKSLPLKDGRHYQIFFEYDARGHRGGFTSNKIAESTSRKALNAFFEGKTYRGPVDDYQLQSLEQILDRVYAYDVARTDFTGMDVKITELNIP